MNPNGDFSAKATLNWKLNPSTCPANKKKAKHKPATSGVAAAAASAMMTLKVDLLWLIRVLSGLHRGVTKDFISFHGVMEPPKGLLRLYGFASSADSSCGVHQVLGVPGLGSSKTFPYRVWKGVSRDEQAGTSRLYKGI